VATEGVWQFRPVYEGVHQGQGRYGRGHRHLQRDEAEVQGEVQGEAESGLGRVRGYFEGAVAWEEEDRDADGEFEKGGRAALSEAL
jgi:hypothetical protein